MFISNISQTQSTKFSFKSNIQKCFPARELILEKLDNNLAKQLGVKVPTTKDEQKTVVSKIYKQLHMIMLSEGKQLPILRNFRMPSTQEEKDAQIEFLKNRKPLDKWAQLIFEKLDLIMTKNVVSNLNNPKISKETKDIFIPHKSQMEQELQKADDLKATLRSLNSQISYEEMSYPKAVKFFKDLEKLKAIYEQNGLITEDMEFNYWQILKNESINKTNLSVGQLLELVQKHSKVQTSSAQLTKAQKAEIKAQKKAAEAARKAQIEAAAKARKAAAQELEKQKQAEKAASAEKRLATKTQEVQTGQNSSKKTNTNNSNTTTSKPKILSPKQLKSIIPLEYGKLLCKNIDFYRIMADNSKLFNKLIFRIPVTTLDYEKKRAHDIIWEKYSDSIDRCDHKSIVALEKDMGDKFNQYYRFKNLVTNKVPEMNNVGGMWNYMEGKEGILEMRRYVAEINELRTKLQDDPHNQSLLQNIARRDILLEQDKDLWIECLKKSIEGERANYEKCVKNKCATEYIYLTSESVSLNGYKRLYEICEANDGELPDEIWNRIFTYAGDDGKLSEEAWAKILE